jgi:site-specific DNA-methyltransferase (adenine-specific)
MKQLPGASVDFVLTDPPYVADYEDRRGRHVTNDQTPWQVIETWGQVARVMKADTLCFSFYSWSHIDAFAEAWNLAGLIRVGHIVFAKPYASAQSYTRYSHECGYLLAKGSPELPEHPVSDVMPWHYSGNRRHPTEKSVETLKPIIEAFTKAGDLVLDPYAGSGSSLVASALLNRRYLGIEIDAKYCEGARRRLQGVSRHLTPSPLTP